MTLTDIRLDAELTVAALAREARVDRRVVERAEAGETITAVNARKIVKTINRITGRNDTEKSLGIMIA